VAAFADIHLGKPGAPGYPWAQDAVGAALDQGTDLVIFAGDLVDRNHATDVAVGDAESLLTSAASTNVPVLVVWGNHDIAAGLPDRVHPGNGVVTAPVDRVTTLEVGNLSVHTISVATDPDPRTVIPSFPVVSTPVPGKVHLGVLHSGVDGRYSGKPCLPTSVTELEACGYDRWLLGHVHQPIQLTESIGWVGMGKTLILDL